MVSYIDVILNKILAPLDLDNNVPKIKPYDGFIKVCSQVNPIFKDKEHMIKS